ncbi:MAG: hypothetical protein EOO38_12985 [Cytophagaceae bacterium]|nr:MAG: hypothetical protein EOO38_12985 [Cytophagaceae bacterium]
MVARISSSGAEELHAIVVNTEAMRQVWLVNALVCNPNLSAEDVHVIAASSDPAYYEKQRPYWVSDAGNHKGFSIMRLIDMHKNIQPKTLAMLSKYIDRDPYIVLDVVHNPKTLEADAQAAIDALAQLPNGNYSKVGLSSNRERMMKH